MVFWDLTVTFFFTLEILLSISMKLTVSFPKVFFSALNKFLEFHEIIFDFSMFLAVCQILSLVDFPMFKPDFAQKLKIMQGWAKKHYPRVECDIFYYYWNFHAILTKQMLSIWKSEALLICLLDQKHYPWGSNIFNFNTFLCFKPKFGQRVLLALLCLLNFF